eukprot:4020133-Pyramimonas_sp.AAC.1
MGPFRVGLTPSRGQFGLSWASAGPSWGRLGPPWGLPGGFLAHLGSLVMSQVAKNELSEGTKHMQ